jgi:putative transport protein
MTGKTLGDMRLWESYTVVITRIRREGLEITPTGNVTLEMGDQIRVVGDRDAVVTFVRLVQGAVSKAEETNMVPFLTGLLLGIAVGSIPIHLPNGLTFKLGIAGGAFIVSLMVGHFGKIGPFRMYVPWQRKISRELGCLFWQVQDDAGGISVEILETRSTIATRRGAGQSSRFWLGFDDGPWPYECVGNHGCLMCVHDQPPGKAANAQTEPTCRRSNASLCSN